MTVHNEAENRWKQFGEWIKEQRLTARLNSTEAATRAGVTLPHWSRWENGNSGVKRETIPAILTALMIKAGDPRIGECYAMAGFAPPDISSMEDVPRDADFSDDDADAVMIDAAYRGAPPEVQAEIKREIAKIVAKHRRERVIGKKAE